ncbi:MAG: c-type cytochrome [Deltaproteobacteria bacterium]|nr:c-type cytochrome [Deltaproteobacteria bacterium]
MSKVVGKVFIFLLVLVALFLWVGKAITDLTGGERRAGGAITISPEGGEAIFWGKGRCYTCHSLGEQGSAVRCPNLGVFGDKFPLAIGQRAIERAKEREKTTGLSYTVTDYLVESLANPGAYIVEGYKNEMAVVYAPPISLTLDEIKAVITYLQSQGGEVDVDAINNPGEVSKRFWERIAAATLAGGGDPGHGEEVFKQACINCHILKGQGGKVGPDLTGIGKKGLKFLSESILQPAATFTPGYETYIVIEKDGRKTVGIKTKDDATGVEITKENGEVVAVPRDKIKEITKDENKSIMSEELIEVITVKDFQDLLAFMMMQKETK